MPGKLCQAAVTTAVLVSTVASAQTAVGAAEVVPSCSTVVAQVMSDIPIPAFGGLSVPGGTYRSTYVFGAMKRYTGQTGWDVQHYTPSGFFPDRGIFVVDLFGSTYQKLPGVPTNSTLPTDAEAANAGASGLFTWPGGSMFVQHVDNPHTDNLPWVRQPTWEICKVL